MIFGFGGLALVGIGCSFYFFYPRHIDDVIVDVEGDDETIETSEITVTEVEESVEPEEILFQQMDLASDVASATAKRGITGDLFTHVIVATLPAIDPSTEYFEGWLVKPDTLEFFSTGEFFYREDGKWGLVWEKKVIEAPEDLVDYRKVVITKEERGGESAPSPIHLLEGEFEVVVDN